MNLGVENHKAYPEPEVDVPTTELETLAMGTTAEALMQLLSAIDRTS